MDALSLGAAALENSGLPPDIAATMIRQTAAIAANLTDILMASIGVGSNFHASA